MRGVSAAALQRSEIPSPCFAEPNLKPVSNWLLLISLLQMAQACQPTFRRHVCRRTIHSSVSLVERIMNAAAEGAEITLAQLKSEARASHIARPRQVAMWLSYKHSGLSMPQIARKFGKKDHTTVLHGNQRVEQRLEEGDAATVALVRHITEALAL